MRAPARRWPLVGITEFTMGAHVTLPEMLDVLCSMPQLDVLRVHHCRAVWEAATVQGEGIGTASAVALPCLRLIAFRDTTPWRFVLLTQGIDALPTVRWHLFWRSWAVASWERWTDLLRTMRAFAPHDSTPGNRLQWNV